MRIQAKSRYVRVIGRATLLMGGATAFFAAYGDAASVKPIETATSMSPSERAQGAKAHPELLAEFGGLYQGPQAAYVVQVGRKIAVQSSLSNQQQDFTISLLDSSVNNAFAIPGGYVYVTRQLLGLMNDEAELASVLGHEVGHVAAQHSKKREQAATRNSILGVLGQVLVGQVAGNNGLGSLLQKGIGTGVQLLTLKYSRSQEYEADDLGVRYLAKAGYDPSAASSMLASLAAQTALDSQTGGKGGSIPEWASTHPDPAARVHRALAAAQATGATSKLRNKAVFLSQLEGLRYGDDPNQGIVSNGQFLHRGLKLRFNVPEGFVLDNQPQAVIISNQSVRAELSAGRLDGDLDRYVQAQFARIAGQGGAMPSINLSHTTINGLSASYATAAMSGSDGQALAVTVIGYALDANQACHFIVVTPNGQSMGNFVGTVNSMSRMTDQEAAAIKSRKIHLVTVKTGDSPASLSRQMAFADRQLERFLVLNGLAANATLTPGSKIKLVVF